MTMTAEERSERRRERRAEQLRDEHEPQYGELTIEELKNEILRLLTQQQDLEEQKKAQADSYNALIKEKKGALEYCRERIDFIQHQEAVNNQLEQGAQ